MSSRYWSVLCAAVVIAAPRLAHAAPPEPLDVTWSAPPECPSEHLMRAAVLGLLGRAQLASGAPPIPVHMTATRSEQGTWSVRIEIVQPGAAAPRERHIDGDSCAEIADAAAVVTALAIAPSLGAPPPDRPAPPAAPPSDPPRDRPEPPPRPAQIHAGLRAAGGADFASLPSPSPGASLAGVLLFGDNRFEILGAGWLPEQAASLAKSTAGGHISLITAGARYCRAFLRRPVEIAGCAGFEAGAMIGRGFGVSNPTTGASPWVALGPGLLGLYPISSTLALMLGVDGLVPLARGAFALDGIGDVYRAPSISGRALGGIEFRFR